MPDPTSKFEEDWTKIVVGIVEEKFDRQTDPQTYIQVTLLIYTVR